MITVGVLGGMGPAASVDFVRRVIDATPARCDQQHFRILHDCDPAVPDRTKFLLGTGPSPLPRLIKMADGLRVEGARLLVMPCNTASVFLPTLQDAVRGVEWVDWPAVVRAELIRRGGTVEILATAGTMRARIHHAGLQHVVRSVDQRRVSRLIEVVKHGGRGRVLAGALAQIVAGSRADLILLGCTELSLLGCDEPRVVDASQVVAEHVVREALYDDLRRREAPASNHTREPL